MSARLAVSGLTLLVSLCYASLAPAALVHRYQFNGSADDSVGGANGALVNNTGNASYGSGRLTLGNDGSQSSNANNGDYVDLPNGIISALGNHGTFEAWVTWNGPGDSNWQRIFDFGTSDGGENQSSGGTNSYYVFMTPRNSSTGTYRVGYRNPSGSPVEQTISHTSALPVGSQRHVALVWDGTAGTATMYLNGQSVGSNTLHMALSDLTDNNNWLGRAQWNDPMFTGSFNEFRIYDHALSATEVQGSFLQGANLNTGLVHRYSFNGNADDSVGGAHGTLVNTTGGSTYGGGVLHLGNDGTQTSGGGGGGATNGDYVDLPNGIISDLGNSATVEVWLTWNGGSGNWQRIFDFGRSDGGEDISDSGGAQHFVMMTPRSSGSQMELHYRNGSSTTALTRSAMSTGEKLHVALVWDGAASEARMYWNGHLVDSDALNMSLSDLSDVNNWLGRSQYGGDAMLAADLHEVRIYNKALSSLEIGSSRLAGTEDLNTANVQRVVSGAITYHPINLADALPNTNINYDQLLLDGGEQTLGGVPFDIADVGGNNGWNSHLDGGDGSDVRSLTIPVGDVYGVIEADVLLGTYWGEKTTGTYASLIFEATDGTTFTVELDGESELRDYQTSGFADIINGITTTEVLTDGNRRVDMTKIILPDAWSSLTLASITLEDRGYNGLQRTFLTGLTVAAAIPEPSTFVLAGLGLLALGFVGRRRRRG